jgi:hypothetical protein
VRKSALPIVLPTRGTTRSCWPRSHVTLRVARGPVLPVHLTCRARTTAHVSGYGVGAAGRPVLGPHDGVLLGIAPSPSVRPLAALRRMASKPKEGSGDAGFPRPARRPIRLIAVQRSCRLGFGPRTLPLCFWVSHRNERSRVLHKDRVSREGRTCNGQSCSRWQRRISWDIPLYELRIRT